MNHFIIIFKSGERERVCVARYLPVYFRLEMDADIEYTDPTYYDFFIQSSTEIVNFWNKLEPERNASLL